MRKQVRSFIASGVVAVSCAGTFQPGVARAALASDASLLHRWTFNANANDDVGGLKGTLSGTTILSNGFLRVMGYSSNSRMESEPIGRPLTNKTLVAWCTVDDIGSTAPAYGGGPLAVSGNDLFDSIDYGERSKGRWRNGSNSYNRTPSGDYGDLEDSISPKQVMLAFAYDYNPDNVGNVTITLYRNAKEYYKYTSTGGQVIPETATVLVGPRHWTGTSTKTYKGYLNGMVDEIRVYDRALTAAEVSELYAEGPVPSPVVTPWNGNFEYDRKWSSHSPTNVSSGRPTGWYLWSGTAGNFYQANKWYYANPPEGFSRVCQEGEKACYSTLEKRPIAYTPKLGNLEAGCSYRVDCFVQTSIQVGKFSRPVIDFYDLDAQEVCWRHLVGDFHMRAETNKTFSVSVTSPVFDARRDGHAVCLRLSCDTLLNGNIPVYGNDHFTGLRIGWDDIRITRLPGQVPPTTADAAWSTTADGRVSDAANWENGKVPFGAGRTVTFRSRGNVMTNTVVTLDRIVEASTLAFEQEGASKGVWELRNEGRGDLRLAGANGAAPTVSVGSGVWAVAESADVTGGLVKSGDGTFQLGGWSRLTGDIDVRAGRLVLGDELAHRWTFNDASGHDSAGLADGAVTSPAAIANGQLSVPAAGRFVTDCVRRPFFARTLVVWTTLTTPAERSTGSALSLCSPWESGQPFDGIVYAENQANTWRLGSENYDRTDTVNRPDLIQETKSEEVMIAAGADLCVAAIYTNACFVSRNAGTSSGTNYFAYSKTGSNYKHFWQPPASCQICIGPRHMKGPTTYHASVYRGTVNEARIYRRRVCNDLMAAIYAAGPDAGIGEGQSSVRSLPAGIKVKMAAGATLDLNLRNQTVAEFTGEGAIVNGALAASKYTLTGPLTVQDALSLPANVTLDYASESASLQVAGKLMLPTIGTAKVALSDKSGRKTVTLFSSGTPVDWANALKGWRIDLPDAKTWKAVPVSTPNSFGYTFKRIGFVLLVR